MKRVIYQPHAGDIFLVPMPGIGGQLIRLGQLAAGDGWTKYQHAGVVAHPGTRTDYTDVRTIEAYPGGAKLLRLGRFDPDEIVWLRCPPEYRVDVANAAISFRGVGYSFMEYPALGLHRFHVPAPHLKSFIASRGSMICSQLADASAASGGWHIFDDGRWPGFVTPNDLGKAAALQSPTGYVERVKVSR